MAEKEEVKEVKEVKSKKVVEIDSETLNELIASNKKLLEERESVVSRLSELEKNAVAQDTNSPRVLKQARTKEIGVREYDKKIVIGWANKGTQEEPEYVYDVYDDQKKEFVQYIDLIFLGETKPQPVKYVEFARRSIKRFYKVEKEIDNPDVVIEKGFVQKKEMTDNGYGMMITDAIVPLENVIKSKTFVVTIDGQQVEIQDKFIG
jgi:hypothetical protein